MSIEDGRSTELDQPTTVPIAELIDHHQRSAQEVGAGLLQLSGYLGRNPNDFDHPVVLSRIGYLAGRRDELAAFKALIEATGVEIVL